MITFFYSTINAGKTANLIISAHACSERNLNYKIFVPAIASGRDGLNKVSSRVGIEQNAISITENDNLYEIIHTELLKNMSPIKIVFIDEVQFLTLDQVVQLTEISDKLDIEVHAYGLRTDFKGEPFKASKYLLCWADHIREIETWADDGKEQKLQKAIMNIKVDERGNRICDGDSISVGYGYKAVSRSAFNVKNNWRNKND